jgi:ABC-type bacteriocin/lantibiotic exporter with double-glycine peptidase domain
MNYFFLGKATRNEISPVQFITFFSMLIVYRDKMTGFIQEIPDMIEMFGRGETVLEKLDEMGINNITLEKKQYQDPELEFGIITYKDVTFKYDGSDRNVLTNFNQEITTNNKIIGIVGHSGNGKSTIMNLLLRLYKPNSGTIMIDGHDITTISPEYIRSNVTFINQNSRLFDTKVIDNMMYGCKQEDDCKRNLKNVMEYEKIKELYKRINIYDDSAGTMGENLSGGQRQIVNVISGLINPSPILVLDEPTNALDPGLKRELLNVIQDFRKFKKSIIIITHDKEVQSLFDTTVQM